MYDCLLKGGRVVDPAQGVDGVRDVAIKDGRVASVQEAIAPGEAKVTYDLRGKIVTPGLIDAHCHPVLDFTDHAVHPDHAGVNAGVALVNDGGSAGAANFHTLRAMYAGKTRTAMTFFLNIASCGLISPPEIRAARDIDVAALKKTVAANPGLIRGLKLRLFDELIGMQPDVVQVALDAAESLGLPLMVHVGGFRQRTAADPLDAFSRDAVSRLRAGDIISHYMTWRPGGMVLPNGTIFPELRAARDRGVLLDCSHGRNNFSLEVARTLLAGGLGPDIISTDLSSVGMHHVQSLLVTMSKFLCLGVPLADVIAATTCRAASALGMAEAWGSLQAGRAADVSVLEEVGGNYTFVDGAAGNHMVGDRLLEPRMVLRDGEPLPCRSYYQLLDTAV